MQDYRDYYNRVQGRTTTTRPPGQRSWWDSLKESFAAPATGQATGGTAGATVPTTPRPVVSTTRPPVGGTVDLYNAATTPRPVTISGAGTIQNNQLFRSDATTPRPVTISGAGTIQNNQLFRSDATTPRPVTISGAGTIQNNRLYRSDGTTPETIGSPVDLYSAANDGSVPTTPVPGGTTRPPTTPVPGEIDGSDDEIGGSDDEIGGVDLGQAGQDAYQRNLANILQGIDTRKQAAGEGFSDLYQQFKDQRTMQQSMTDPRGLTGGMERQEGARQSAAEIGAMTDLASQRQRAVDQIESEKMTAELQAGRMTAEQYELEKQTSPAWQQGELLAQKYNETGNIDDFNEYLTHMAGLLGIEPSLANANNPEAAMAQVSENVKTKINQYIQNPDLLQNLTGAGTSALAGIGAAFTGVKGIAALGALGKAIAGPSVATALGGALTGTGAKAGVIAALGLKGVAAAAFWPVTAGVLATLAIVGVVRMIRSNKTPEQADIEIDKLLTKERQKIIDGGFSEQEADEAIAGLRKTLPTRYQG